MISFLRKKRTRPVGNTDIAASRMHQRLHQVIAALGALEPEPGALDDCLEKLATSPNPWRDRQNLSELTEIAARLSFSVDLLVGLMGEHDLVAGAGDYTIAALQRGILPALSTDCEQLISNEQIRKSRCQK